MIDSIERAVPELGRLPRYPGAGSAVVRCRDCNKVIAMSDGHTVWQRHKGRESVSRLPADVRCDGCGKWTPIAPHAA